jgi:hypothetical protein
MTDFFHNVLTNTNTKTNNNNNNGTKYEYDQTQLLNDFYQLQTHLRMQENNTNTQEINDEEEDDQMSDDEEAEAETSEEEHKANDNNNSNSNNNSNQQSKSLQKTESNNNNNSNSNNSGESKSASKNIILSELCASLGECVSGCKCVCFSRNSRPRENDYQTQTRRRIFYIQQNRNSHNSNSQSQTQAPNMNEMFDFEFEEIELQSTLDIIHNYILHSRINTDENGNDSEEYDNKHYQKFISQIIDNDQQPQNQNQILNNVQYSNSIDMDYWLETDPCYIPVKYRDLKSEFLSNNINALEVYCVNQLQHKAQKWLTTDYVKLDLKCKREHQWMMINKQQLLLLNSVITIGHLIVILSYTNNTRLFLFCFVFCLCLFEYTSL